jgi:large subunit ribosomal protein L21
VRAGGRQEKIEVGSIVVLDRIKADKDGNVELVPVLLPRLSRR